jgi:hypothetical protein
MPNCQLPHDKNVQAIYDAKLATFNGQWGYVCNNHFNSDAYKTPGTFTTLENIGKAGREPYSD